MKKIFFLICCCFCLISFAYADKVLYVGDLKENSPVLNEIFTNNDRMYLWVGSGLDDLLVSYYSKDGSLLESYGAVRLSLEYNIGMNCIDLYESIEPGNSFNCNLGQLGIYSSGKDISKIKYWKVLSYEHYYDNNNWNFGNFCFTHKDTHNSKLCSDLIFKSIFDFSNIWHYIEFIEYEPATFELICDTNENDITNCKIKLNATDEIKEITLPIRNDLYEFVDYKESEGWKITRNSDDTITLTSDFGFKGVDVILESSLKIISESTDAINLDIADLSYTTFDDNVLTTDVSTIVSVKKDEVVNPNTKDFNVILVVFIVFVGCLGIIVLKPKKIYS